MVTERYPLAIIAYWLFTSDMYSQLIAASPDIVITDTPNGPWRVSFDISILANAGIKVFSYVDGGYEGTKVRDIANDLVSALKFISDIATRDIGVYGIFLDEVSSHPSPNGLVYLKAIKSACEANKIKLILNTGTPDIDTILYSLADYVLTDENYTGRLPFSTEKGHLAQTIVIGNSVNTPEQAALYTNNAWKNGFGHSYHCPTYTVMPMPYWLAKYVSLLTPPKRGCNPLSKGLSSMGLRLNHTFKGE